MYDIIFTWYVHTHSSILNLYLCTHYMQQHCCNVLFIVIFIYIYIIPGNMYVDYIYIFTDVHTYHTCVLGALSFLFTSYKSSQGWL